MRGILAKLSVTGVLSTTGLAILVASQTILAVSPANSEQFGAVHFGSGFQWTPVSEPAMVSLVGVVALVFARQLRRRRSAGRSPLAAPQRSPLVGR
jgi:hypothetical protein